MRRRIIQGVLCLLVAASFAGSGEASAARARRAPAESFLEYRVGTVDALALQAERNPRVRARYARQFGIPSSRVASYIRENLVVSYLPSSGYRTVYYVNPGGRIYSRRAYLPRGTRVLTLRNGEPVLRWICGNAMVPTLPHVAVAPFWLDPAVPVVSVPVEQVVSVPAVVSVPTQVAVAQVVTPVSVPVPTPAVVPVPTPVVPVVVPVPSVAPRSTGVLPVAVGSVLPGIIGIGGQRPPAITELPPSEIPIPEPGTLAILTLSALPAAWAAARARRIHAES